jgi:toxin ParE1/3/4
MPGSAKNSISNRSFAKPAERIPKRSKRDLLEVWQYYERVASVEIAEKLLRQINSAGQRLADEALMWRTRDEVMPGLRSVLVHPYTIFYRVKDDVVEIVRVLHERRDFGAAFSKEQR